MALDEYPPVIFEKDRPRNVRTEEHFLFQGTYDERQHACDVGETSLKNYVGR